MMLGTPAGEEARWSTPGADVSAEEDEWGSRQPIPADDSAVKERLKLAVELL